MNGHFHFSKSDLLERAGIVIEFYKLGIQHWIGNVMLMELSSLAAPYIVKMTTVLEGLIISHSHEQLEITLYRYMYICAMKSLILDALNRKT